MGGTNIKSKGTKAFGKQNGGIFDTGKENTTKKIDSFGSDVDSIFTEENFNSSAEEESKEVDNFEDHCNASIIAKLKEIKDRSKELNSSVDPLTPLD